MTWCTWDSWICQTRSAGQRKVIPLCLSPSPITRHKRHILENLGIDEPVPSNGRGQDYVFKVVSKQLKETQKEEAISIRSGGQTGRHLEEKLRSPERKLSPSPGLLSSFFRGPKSGLCEQQFSGNKRHLQVFTATRYIRNKASSGVSLKLMRLS